MLRSTDLNISPCNTDNQSFSDLILFPAQNCTFSPRYDLNHCRATCREAWAGREQPEQLLLHGGTEDIWVDQFGIQVSIKSNY